MPINTTLAGLSQTPSSNGPDGTVDAPSTIDDAIRNALSFTAMLRDNVGFTAGAKAALGANSDITSLSAVTAINSGAVGGLHNRIINPGMEIDQFKAGAAFSISLAGGYSGIDRWNTQTTGAAVTGQQAGYAGGAGLPVATTSFSVTGAASNTGVFLIHRIRAANSKDLAGGNVRLSLRAYVSGAAPTSFNYALRYATAVDNFGAVTAIANGTFTLNTVDGLYSATIAVPSGALTGLELLLSTGAFTAGTLFFTNVQIEPGTVTTQFERRPYELELALCQHYLRPIPLARLVAYQVASGVIGQGIGWPPMRATPSVVSPTYSQSNVTGATVTASGSSDAQFTGSVTVTGTGDMQVLSGHLRAEL